VEEVVEVIHLLTLVFLEVQEEVEEVFLQLPVLKLQLDVVQLVKVILEAQVVYPVL
tara:strand:+ start:168 stop:335 length:168 start_codon:yes stop_codon:yes gene_type:complete